MNFALDNRDFALCASDEVLCRDCEFDFFKSTGNGGQKRNKTSSAVRIIHRPTGLQVTDCSERSQHANRRAAFAKLRLAIAVAYRFPPDGTIVDLTVSCASQRYPLTVAKVLDVLSAANWDPAAAAVALEVSKSRLLKFLARDGSLGEVVNHARQKAGLGFLHF